MPFKDPEKRREWNRKYYHRTKDPTPGARYKKIKHNILTYKKRNRLLENKRVRDWASSEKGKEYRAKYRDRANELFKESVKNLTESYLKRRLKYYGYTEDQLKKYPEIISTYKTILKTKRLCKSQTSKS